MQYTVHQFTATQIRIVIVANKQTQDALQRMAYLHRISGYKTAIANISWLPINVTGRGIKKKRNCLSCIIESNNIDDAKKRFISEIKQWHNNIKTIKFRSEL